VKLGRLGIWSGALRAHSDPALPEAVAELEERGYGTLWFPAGRGTRAFEIAATLLAATRQTVVASGIVSIWETSVQQAETGFADLESAAPGRFLLGLGVSHAPLVNRNGADRYQRPLQAMTTYLHELAGVPATRRILAALRPKMLELALAESIGTHPYLVTPEMTAELRSRAGSAVVATELAVVIATDSQVARAAAREYLSMYLRLPNYVNNWLRHGYTEADVADGGSDRLVDALVGWGDVEQVAARVAQHHTAGADHVCVQVLGAGDGLPMPQLRLLADAVPSGRSQ
jgi:probable F420-dependent oxidoreductase